MWPTSEQWLNVAPSDAQVAVFIIDGGQNRQVPHNWGNHVDLYSHLTLSSMAGATLKIVLLCRL